MRYISTQYRIVTQLLTRSGIEFIPPTSMPTHPVVQNYRWNIVSSYHPTSQVCTLQMFPGRGILTRVLVYTPERGNVYVIARDRSIYHWLSGCDWLVTAPRICNREVRPSGQNVMGPCMLVHYDEGVQGTEKLNELLFCGVTLETCGI